MVSSKWAAQLPSAVTAVQRSSSTRTSHEPMVTMGSMASTMPALMTGPRPASPKFGICGSSWRLRPIPWPTKARTTPKPWLSQWRLHRVGDVAEPVARPALHDGLVEALAGDVEQLLHPRAAPRPTGRVIAQSA